MAVNIQNRWCSRCQAHVKAERHSVNHILHLLLSLVTFGIWIPIWFLLAISRSYRCSVCGADAKDPFSAGSIAFALFVAFVVFAILSSGDDDTKTSEKSDSHASFVVTERSVIYDAPNVPLPKSFARKGLELPAISESRDGFSKFVDVEASGRKQTFWLRDADFDPIK